MRRNLGYILLLLFCASCVFQDAKLSTIYNIQDDPLKILIIKNYSDSTRVLLMVPMAIEINNSNHQSVKFTKMAYSQSGGNIYSMIGPKLFEYVNNQLTYEPVKNRTVSSRSSESYKLYMAYNVTLDGTIREKIFKDSVFSHTRNDKNVFNIPNTELNLGMYSEKISDSLKGFIHLNYTNPKNDQLDYLNIPIQF
ncbi:hypothetical protein QSV08_11645 [Maribacter sp. BPC-D8]|uniref:hypothetical protein n=1 Tax=Maribacter sp. BPC-D8 TaxID=3053613 RepID=UPI002B4687B7|nr:hypothetical protein [Maribacter sp. BPC-D8]WRI27877.1 hypothetical protein QSV08_11645 [Maribacter sp. BPC-D8]